MSSPPFQCGLCDGFRRKEDRRLALDLTPDELEQSANSGKCPLCAILLASVQQFGEATQDKDSSGLWRMSDHIIRMYVYGLSHPRDTLSVEMYHREERRRTLELFYPETSNPNPSGPLVPGVRPRPSISSHPLSKAGLEWATLALRSCSEGAGAHAGCAQGSSKSQALPKRVLQVEQLGSGEITVRLLSNSAKQERYAALSHCWGPEVKRQCITRKSTLKRHTRRIPWDDLPLTFQDAIRFCIAIGVSYIWIDALCIIQDDAADWEVESSRMANIYQNAYITLAATHGDSGASGCFVEPRHGRNCFVEEQELRLPDTMKQWHGLRLREKVQHWGSTTSVKTHPLLSRGWVFQERILSPRVLYFCAEEMVWECGSLTRCECGSRAGSPNTYSSARSLLEDIVATPNVHDESQTDTILLALRTLDAEVDVSTTNNLGTAESGRIESGADRASRALINAFRTLRGQDLIPKPLGSTLSAKTPLTSVKKSRRPRQSQDSHESGESVLSDTMTPRRTNSRRLEPYMETSWGTRCWPDQPVASQRWQKLVEHYSPLLLSKETDRLPALSGIASRVEPHLGGYRCGLWNTTLAPDLLWRASNLKVEPFAISHGPSWSWTSVNGAVQYWSDLRVTIQRTGLASWVGRQPIFISCTAKPAGKNPFGQVASGAEIILEGSLRSAWLQYVWTRQDHSSTARVVDHFRYEVAFGGLEIEMHADHILAEQGPHHMPDHDMVWLLLIHPDVCLVLVEVPASGSKYPTYRRIGIVRQPSSFTVEYEHAVNWLAGSVKKTIRII